jgi:hypothetical protein
MELTGPQITALREALHQAYNPMTLDTMLVEKFDGKHLYDVASPAATFPTMLSQLIALASQEGWILDFIVKAQAYNPGSPELNAFVASLPPELLQPRPPLDPFGVCFLHDVKDWPFVDRAALRTSLASFYAPNGARVVVVKGPADSGKSYSFKFVNYLRQERGGFEAFLIDLSETAGLSYGPDYLAMRIAARMGIEAPSADMLTKATQDPRWAKELCNWIVDRVPATNKVWWIVIDGIFQAGLPPGTLALIHALAHRAALIEPNLRLVLLGYDKANLPSEALPRLVQEELTALERLDLSDFFERLLKQRGLAAGDAITPAVDWIVGRLAPPYLGDPLAQLPALVKEAAEMLDELIGGSGG